MKVKTINIMVYFGMPAKNNLHKCPSTLRLYNAFSLDQGKNGSIQAAQ